MALSFAEKNRLLVKHKNPEYFYTDLELFKKLYPGHKLNNDLANVTAFSKVRLSEQMLLLLLDKASIDEIQSNRGIDPPRELTYDERVEKVLSKYGESYIIKNTADLKDIASMLGHPEPESLSSYVSLVGKPITDLLFDLEDDEDVDDLDKEKNPAEKIETQLKQTVEESIGKENTNHLSEDNLNDNVFQEQISDQVIEQDKSQIIDEVKIEDKKESEKEIKKEAPADKKKEAKVKNSPK